jgi:hypothetical protein
MTADVRAYGTFAQALDAQTPISEINVRCIPLDVIAHWRRCSIMADCLADYLSYNFENVAAAQNIISTVVNELLENAIKFSSEKRDRATISVAHYGEVVRITTVNVSTPQRAETLAGLIEELKREDIDRLFVSHIERSAMSEHAKSGVGLLSVRKDYNARIGVRLRPIQGAGTIEVQVEVCLDVDQVEIGLESRSTR